MNYHPLWAFMSALFLTLIFADSVFLYFSFDWATFDQIYVWWLRAKPFLAAGAIIAVREVSRSPGATYSAIALGAFLSLIYWYHLRVCGVATGCY
jgi:hypothetical protein